MIDVNDLNKLDCEKARKDALDCYSTDTRVNSEAALVRIGQFIDQVAALQRKYTKPIASLLKGPYGSALR